MSTSIAIDIPNKNLVGYIFARSGLASKYGVKLANNVGVVDSDYKGNIILSLHNDSDKPYTIQPYERVVQLVISPVLPLQFEETDMLSSGVRGDRGFGSTGK